MMDSVRTLATGDWLAGWMCSTNAVSTAVGRLGRASTMAEASEAVASVPLELVVVDFELDKNEVYDLVASRSRFRTPTYVVVSESATPAEGFRLAQLGVRALVPKSSSPSALADTLRAALNSVPDLTPHLRALVGHRSMQEIERVTRRTLVDEALARAKGSKTEAARLLSVSRQLLQHMVRGQKRFA